MSSEQISQSDGRRSGLHRRIRQVASTAGWCVVILVFATPSLGQPYRSTPTRPVVNVKNTIAQPIQLLRAKPAALAKPPRDFAASQAGTALAKAEPQITIDVSFDEAFFSSPAAVEYLRRVSTYIPPRQASLGQGDTLRDLVAREYAIGVKHVELADNLVSEILRLNKITDPRAVRVGKLLIPNFPADPAPRNMDFARPPMDCNALSGVQLPREGMMCTAYSIPTELAWDRSPKAKPAGSVVWRQRLTLPKTLADLIAGQGLFSDSTIKNQFLNGDATVVLADGPDNPEGKYPFPPTLNLECAAASSQANVAVRRHTLVVVHDTGWPTSGDRTASFQKLQSIFQKLWEDLGVTDCGYSRSAPVGNFSTPHDHCTKIARALDCFQWRTNAAVDTVFLPLSRDQGADDLLLELFHLYYLIPHSVANAANDFSLPTADEIKNAKKRAVETLKRIPPRITTREINMDYALIAAPLAVLSYYGLRNPDWYYVMSYSWTVLPRRYEIPFPSPLGGTMVTAAGNGGKNIAEAPLVDFASRCAAGTGDTVCVANFQPGIGKWPGTSYLDDLPLEPPVPKDLYVGFDGSIGVDTATSFACPRVAWLIGAANSVRPYKIINRVSWRPWLTTVLAQSKRRNLPDSDFLQPATVITNAAKSL